VLAVLLAKPGELVTRDELRGRLWTADTFVTSITGSTKPSTRSVRPWVIPPRVLASLRP